MCNASYGKGKLSGAQICDLRDAVFITSQELEDMYPQLSAHERENEITRQKKTVFIMQIGDKLKSGVPHDGRAPDYDDWSLNGDLLMWSDVFEPRHRAELYGYKGR